MSRFKAVQSLAQADHHRDQITERDPFRGPWFSSATACAYLDSPTPDAFRKWAQRHGIQFRYRGRRVLVAKADLDRAIGAGPRVVRRKVS